METRLRSVEMFKRTSCLLPILLLGTLATIGRANAVTFTSFSPTDTCLSALSTGGLTFTNNGSICLGVWTSSPNTPGAGDLILGYTGYVAVTQTGGGAFNFNSVDMTISWYDSLPTDTVDVTADFQGGGSSSETLTLMQGLQTYNLNYSNVSEVDITAPASDTGYWAIDNINYTSAVPEPSALLPLLVLSVLVLAFQRKKSRSPSLKRAHQKE
jgi:hypothetical protein